jgi:hypothetical protein
MKRECVLRKISDLWIPSLRHATGFLLDFDRANRNIVRLLKFIDIGISLLEEK